MFSWKLKDQKHHYVAIKSIKNTEQYYHEVLVYGRTSRYMANLNIKAKNLEYLQVHLKD